MAEFPFRFAMTEPKTIVTSPSIIKIGNSLDKMSPVTLIQQGKLFKVCHLYGSFFYFLFLLLFLITRFFFKDFSWCLCFFWTCFSFVWSSFGLLWGCVWCRFKINFCDINKLAFPFEKFHKTRNVVLKFPLHIYFHYKFIYSTSNIP